MSLKLKADQLLTKRRIRTHFATCSHAIGLLEGCKALKTKTKISSIYIDCIESLQFFLLVCSYCEIYVAPSTNSCKRFVFLLTTFPRSNPLWGFMDLIKKTLVCLPDDSRRRQIPSDEKHKKNANQPAVGEIRRGRRVHKIMHDQRWVVNKKNQIGE